jgi:hypothetical protein
MPASKAEQVLEAIKALLETVPDAVVERNSALPEKIPAGGLIILRDGDPGEPEQALGGFANVYYQHAVEIEVYVEEGDAAVRDTAFDDLLQQIGTALDADPTLGGLAFGLTYGRPETSIEAVPGAPAIKSATLTVIVDYEAAAPLAGSFGTSAGDHDGASLWFERIPAHEARDDIRAGGDWQLHPHALQPLRPGQPAGPDR